MVNYFIIWDYQTILNQNDNYVVVFLAFKEICVKSK